MSEMVKLKEGCTANGNVAGEVTISVLEPQPIDVDPAVMNIFNFGFPENLLYLVDSSTSSNAEKIRGLNKKLLDDAQTNSTNYTTRNWFLTLPAKVLSGIPLATAVRSKAILLNIYLNTMLNVNYGKAGVDHALLVGLQFFEESNGEHIFMVKSATFYLSLKNSVTSEPYLNLKKKFVDATRTLLNVPSSDKNYDFEVVRMFADRADGCSDENKDNKDDKDNKDNKDSKDGEAKTVVLGAKDVQFKITKSDPSNYNLKGFSDLSNEKITKPFMFEFSLHNFAQISKYDASFALTQKQVEDAKSINEYYNELIGYVADVVSKPWDKIKNELQSLPLPSLQPRYPLRTDYHNIPFNIEHAWEDLLTGVKGFGGTEGANYLYATKLDEIGTAGMAAMILRNLYNNLKSKKKDGKVQWEIVYATYSKVETVEHEGKYYLDSFSVVVAMRPLSDDPIPVVFKASSGENYEIAGIVLDILAIAIITLATTTAMLELFKHMMPSIANVFGINPKSGVKPSTLSTFAIVGASTLGVLVMIYYMFFRKK